MSYINSVVYWREKKILAILYCHIIVSVLLEA